MPTAEPMFIQPAEGKTYETLAEALAAEDTDSDGVITYEIYGKVVLPDGGIKLGKDGIRTINFTKGSDDAELRPGRHRLESGRI